MDDTEDKEMKPLRVYRASAGSGKTYTLAVEYISLLAINPMEYQNILAVTFTNKATTEMKQRILSTLYGIANDFTSTKDYVKSILDNLEARRTMPQYQDEPYRSVLKEMNEELLRMKAKEALSNIIHDYSRFHIETIDSFFQSVVREIANELEMSTNMKVEIDETSVLSDAIDEIIENLREGSNEFRSVIEFIEEKIRGGHSWQVDETVKEFGRNIFKENYLIHGEDVRKKITNYGEIHKYRTLINEYLEGKKKAVIEKGEQLRQAYESCGMADADADKKIVTFIEKVCDYNIAEPFSTSKGTFSETIEKYTKQADLWFKKTTKNREALQPHVETTLMPMLADTFEKHTEYVKHLHTVKAIGQHLYSLMLLNKISDTVKSLNEDSNSFLLSETANFLRNVINHQDIPFIYEKTGAVIKHIMIDEFQDTSTLQWGNFKPLIMSCLSMDGSCLIVGDVKQSIYRFRNSDWQILNNIEQDMELREYMGHVPAQYNYRSSGRVVKFNNNLFRNGIELMKETCPALVAAYEGVEQKVKKNQEHGFVRVENIDYHDKDNLPEVWDKETPESYEEATLQRIQLSVKELMENGVEANDITILIRTNKEVPLICDYFNTHQDVLDVKVVSDDAFRLDASPVINIIIDAMRVLVSQDDDLYLITLEHHLGSPIPPEFEKEARKALRYKALTELPEDIYQRLHLNRFKEQDAYLFHFFDIIEQFGKDHQANLDTFLQAWDEQLCEKTIPNGASDGVRIMTMHKSKGLEFHSVIIPSCSWTIMPKDSEVIWCIPETAPYDRMPLLPISVSKAKEDSIFANDRKEEELRTTVDNINVLYVAFTRAKHNLIILTGNKKDGAMNTKGKVENAQEFLVHAMPKQMEQKDVEGCITIYQDGVIMPSEQKKKEVEQNVMECEYAPLSVSFASHPSFAEFRQSYDSEMFITAESLNPKVQKHTERVRLISLGNLYHAIFERIRTIEDVPHAVQMLEAKGCFGSLLEAKEARDAVTKMIQGVAPQHPEWFSPKWQVLNERAILFPENQEMNTKRPDRVIVKGKQAIIVDYKTAQGVVKVQNGSVLGVPTENRQQIEMYKKLLTQLGYNDVKAFLWYILDDVVAEI